MSQPESLLQYVRERLPTPGTAHFHERLQKIADESGVPYHTLLKIAKGETDDPRVSTVESLRNYFIQREAA
jgi:hypothetical protein